MNEPVVPRESSSAISNEVIRLRAKVAELERTTSNLRLELKAVRDSSAVNLSDSISDIAKQAATFLAENRAMLKDLNDWVEKARDAEKVVTRQADTIKRQAKILRTLWWSWWTMGNTEDCPECKARRSTGVHKPGCELDAALSKQEPAVAKEGE